MAAPSCRLLVYVWSVPASVRRIQSVFGQQLFNYDELKDMTMVVITSAERTNTVLAGFFYRL